MNVSFIALKRVDQIARVYRKAFLISTYSWFFSITAGVDFPDLMTCVGGALRARTEELPPVSDELAKL